MSTNIIIPAKPIFILGKIFGIVPFSLDRMSKHFKIFQILTCIYSSSLITFTILVCYFNIFYSIADFIEMSFVPVFVHQAVEVLFSVVSVSQISCVLFHRKRFMDVAEKFSEIDIKVC